MRSPRRAPWLLVAIAATLIPASSALAAHDPARLLTLRMNAPSLGDPHRSVRVYLPPSYETPAARTRRYPVIYLLHGWPGGEGNWSGEGHATTTLDSLSAAGVIPEVIAVMPSGSGAGLFGRSLYVDAYDGRSRMEQYIVQDLVAWTDGTFRTRAERRDRAIIGLSEGGGAAINLVFKHPDLFGGCGSHSGEFVIGHGLGESRIFGPEPGAAALREANSPLLYLDRVVPRLAGLSIYFDCGLGDAELGQNREMDRRLTKLGVPHAYKEFPGGHSWGYWSKHLHESLRVVTSGMHRS